MKQTKYKIVETSKGRFRVCYSDPTLPQSLSLVWIGGRHSKRYCFWSREDAENCVCKLIKSDAIVAEAMAAVDSQMRVAAE
jgi:hypothetical protein